MRLPLVLAGFAATLLSPSASIAATSGQTPIQAIEVAFVLDTTGSMADLIDGAKKKIWSIADEIRKSRPDARIRFALIGYRDRGDVYVTDRTDLTDDLHGVYGKLVGYQADGGGDWPESVNEALSVAVTKLDWSQGKDTRRLLFLVGDAPPHMDYQQDVPFTETLKTAKARDIVVNAVQAGASEDTEVAWRAIASLGGGDYIAIPQSGNMQVVETPYDNRIRELQLQLNLTVVPYGSSEQRSEVEDKLRTKAEAPAAAASDMASYEMRPAAPSARKVVTGAGDLVADVLEKGAGALAAIPEADLPEDYKELSPTERAAKVEAKIKERETLQGDLGELVEARDKYLLEQTPANDGDSFDGAVKTSIARQLR